MKNKRFAAFIVSTAIIFAGFSFSGCGSNSSTGSAAGSSEAQITDTTINGTLWYDDDQMEVYTFDNNKNFNITARKYNSSRYTVDGTYTLLGDTLTLTFRENHSESLTFKKTSKDGKTVFAFTENSYVLYLNDSDAQAAIQARHASSSQSSK